jgi:ferredoxin-thioredoxin reductase catalytic subunit
MIDISEENIKITYENLKREIESAGYNLNPDAVLTRGLIHGLLVNEKRYGYRACPCRLASGKKNEDIDIICPCDYRDSDLSKYGTCFCALFVSQAIIKGEKKVKPIPESRPSLDKRKKFKSEKNPSLSKPVWRCRVCGYLCGREEPPEICPICKAKKERFEKFIT